MFLHAAYYGHRTCELAKADARLHAAAAASPYNFSGKQRTALQSRGKAREICKFCWREHASREHHHSIQNGEVEPLEPKISRVERTTPGHLKKWMTAQRNVVRPLLEGVNLADAVLVQ
jgi:hypothetical protein